MSKIKLLLDVVEDARAVADSLIPVIEKFKNLAESLQAVADALASTETKAERVDAHPEEPKALPQEAKAEATPSLEQVRAVLADKSRKGHTAEIRALLQKYGAEVERICVHRKGKQTKNGGKHHEKRRHQEN